MQTETIPTAPIQTAVNRSDEMEDKSMKIIRKYILLSSGAALIDNNVADVITSTVAQTMMIRELCQLYDVPYSDKLVNIAFWSVTGSIMTKAITEVVDTVITKSNVEKSFDLTGAAVAGIYTATVGEFYKLHLRDGGTLDNLRFSDFGDYFIDEIRRGDLSLATFTNPKALMSHLNF